MSEVTAIGEFECTDTAFVASFDNLLCDFYIFIVVNTVPVLTIASSPCILLNLAMIRFMISEL